MKFPSMMKSMFFIGEQVSVRIASSSDDAEEMEDGMYLTSTDLELLFMFDPVRL